MFYRQFQLNQKQYKVGDFVLIASSNDDFQEDPMESAYVAKLEDLYSDGNLNSVQIDIKISEFLRWFLCHQTKTKKPTKIIYHTYTQDGVAAGLYLCDWKNLNGRLWSYSSGTCQYVLKICNLRHTNNFTSFGMINLFSHNSVEKNSTIKFFRQYTTDIVNLLAPDFLLNTLWPTTEKEVRILNSCADQE